MVRTYAEVAIQAGDELRERLLAVISQLGFEGFWEDGDTLRCYMESSRWRPGLREEIQRITRLLAHASSSQAPEVSVTTVDDRNWNEEWEKTLLPIHVTDRIVVAPSWQSTGISQEGILLIIDPKMSFGTGYHESTRLALKLLERYLRASEDVLDVGTGTGILAIAAIKLGARSAVGLDTDDWSYTNAQENARLNQVTDNMSVIHGDLSALRQRRYGLVVANIQRSVLEGMLPYIRELLDMDGRVILSGILQEERESMLASMRQEGFRLIGELEENEWIAFAAHKDEPGRPSP